MNNPDVLIIGAGAAGMFCAIEAARRGRQVVLLDHAAKPGEKIRISGGGRCNFTNRVCRAEHYISANPHFMKSALSRYTADDFIARVNQNNIDWHEKEFGQLFCDNRSTDIIQLLLKDMEEAGVKLILDCSVHLVEKAPEGFRIGTSKGVMNCGSLVMATGGKSIPKMGATGFGYDIARQFGLSIIETRPGLVPFTFDPDRLERFKPLAGTSFDCIVESEGQSFSLPALFTHRGLSGPAMLQISSYWREGQAIGITFSEHTRLPALSDYRRNHGKKDVTSWLATVFPKSLAVFLAEEAGIQGKIGDLKKSDIQKLSQLLRQWSIVPAGTEGYRTAEVTVGGIDTDELDARTMQSKHVPGLYFIGELVDVTGWLGGYNFQWAWSSAWVAGQAV